MRASAVAAAVRIAAGSEAFFRFVSLARERDPLTKTGREELAIAAGASPARFDAALRRVYGLRGFDGRSVGPRRVVWLGLGRLRRAKGGGGRDAPQGEGDDLLRRNGP